MKIGEHIAAIRGMLNQHKETEAPMSDQFIYHHFAVVCAMLTKQKYDRSKIFNPFNLRYYCVSLSAGLVHDCGCIAAGCNVLKTNIIVPAPIMGRTSPYIRVMTVDHVDIPYIHPSIAGSVDLDPIRRNRIHYSIVGSRIVLFGANVVALIPRAILVGGFFEDPTTWATIQACSPSGDDLETTCYSLDTDEFPVDADLISNAYQIVLQRLGVTITIPTDRDNDSR